MDKYIVRANYADGFVLIKDFDNRDDAWDYSKLVPDECNHQELVDIEITREVTIPEEVVGNVWDTEGGS